MSHFFNLNDQSSHPPRLRHSYSLWAMDGLPMNAPTPWTLEEKVRQVKEAGFEGLECAITDNEYGRQVRREVQENDLQLTLGHRPFTVLETRVMVELAARWNAKSIFCQPASAFHSLEEVVKIVTEGAKMAADSGISYFVETHRNNFTESIPQTLQLIKAIPDIKLIADFSHFVVCGEFYGWENEGAIEHLRPIIQNVAHVHGRISNGEQVQVDVGDGSGGDGTPAGFFRQIWSEIFKTWRSSAQNGDMMTFTPELGPPRYAITLPDGREFSDRWAQSLVLREMAVKAWNG